MTLTDQDRAILDFAARHYRTSGAHADAVTSDLGMTTTRYFQRLNHLTDTEAALAYNPTLVNRLRRIRQRRQGRP